MNNALSEQIFQLAKLEPKDVNAMTLKLAEETGEVAQAILATSGQSGSSYKKLNSEDALEECVDVLLVATALFHKLNNFQKNEKLNQIASKKIVNWQEKMEILS